MKEATQHAVTLFARVADAAQHTVKRHSQQQQRMRSQHQAAFHDFRHDLRGTGFAQAIQISIVKGAHHHRQIGPHTAHMLKYTQRQCRICRRHHQRTRAHHTRGHQNLAPRRVAKHYVLASSRSFAHPRRIGIQRDKRNFFRPQ